MKHLYFWLLKPCGYNTPVHHVMLYRQWQHQFFLWGWQTYEQYAAKSQAISTKD